MQARGERPGRGFLAIRSCGVRLCGPKDRAHGQGGGEGGAGQASARTALQHVHRQGAACHTSGLLLYADQTGRYLRPTCLVSPHKEATGMYIGKVVLVVPVASFCGLSKQVGVRCIYTKGMSLFTIKSSAIYHLNRI